MSEERDRALAIQLDDGRVVVATPKPEDQDRLAKLDKDIVFLTATGNYDTPVMDMATWWSWMSKAMRSPCDCRRRPTQRQFGGPGYRCRDGNDRRRRRDRRSPGTTGTAAGSATGRTRRAGG